MTVRWSAATAGPQPALPFGPCPAAPAEGAEPGGPGVGAEQLRDQSVEFLAVIEMDEVGDLGGHEEDGGLALADAPHPAGTVYNYNYYY